jgi:ribonuclease HI
VIYTKRRPSKFEVSAQVLSDKYVILTAALTDSIELYTDGAASGNPGPGGYGVVLKYKNHRKEISAGFKLTTNNRMELMAVIVGLESITNTDLPVKIFSDSKYVVDAINQNWILGWQRTGFKNKANVDLWRRFLKVYKPAKHKFFWVKGHASNVENNRCDELAVAAYKLPGLISDEGYIPK